MKKHEELDTTVNKKKGIKNKKNKDELSENT